MRVIGVWTVCGTWSAKHLTDGAIPADTVTEEGATHVDAMALVAARLWHTDGHDCPRCPDPARGDYQFHDWAQYQKLRADVLAERAQKAAAGKLGGAKSGAARRSRTEAGASPKNEAGASRLVEPPSLPFPTQTPNPVQDLVRRRLFGDAWRKSTTDDEMRDLRAVWAETAGPGVDLEAELRAWLIHNGGTDLRNPGAALLGWLRTAEQRAAKPALELGCWVCIKGWIPDEFGQPSEHRCTTCRPHLRAVGEAS